MAVELSENLLQSVWVDLDPDLRFLRARFLLRGGLGEVFWRSVFFCPSPANAVVVVDLCSGRLTHATVAHVSVMRTSFWRMREL